MNRMTKPQIETILNDYLTKITQLVNQSTLNVDELNYAKLKLLNSHYIINDDTDFNNEITTHSGSLMVTLQHEIKCTDPDGPDYESLEEFTHDNDCAILNLFAGLPCLYENQNPSPTHYYLDESTNLNVNVIYANTYSTHVYIYITVGN